MTSLVNSRLFFSLPRLLTACILCGGACRSTALCEGCLGDLPRPGPACQRCGLTLSPCAENLTCAACNITPPPQQWLLTGCRYEWPVDRLIAAFKDDSRLQAGRALLPALLESIEQTAGTRSRPDLLAPVPASPGGLRRRGFQQSALLARWTGRALGIPNEPHLLRRNPRTRPQRGLSRGERRRNLRDQLRCARRLAGEHIALIDDVITTGSTVAEASRVLLAAGAREVSVWGLARASQTSEQTVPVR